MIEFLASNWPWIALIAFFVVMHRGGHGCGMHGAHGAHGAHGDHSAHSDGAPIGKDRAEPTGVDQSHHVHSGRSSQ